MHDSRSPSRTYAYLLVTTDFLFAVALMVLGMVSLVKGIVVAHDWETSYFFLGYHMRPMDRLSS